MPEIIWKIESEEIEMRRVIIPGPSEPPVRTLRATRGEDKKLDLI